MFKFGVVCVGFQVFCIIGLIYFLLKMKNLYRGMTVNERLYFSGLMEQFDKALVEKDRARLVTILKEVELNDENINAILRSKNLKEEGD
jgi:ABC-type multidrug transport system ATPase subunit